MSEWRPIASDELQRLICESLDQSLDQSRHIFELIRIEPEKWLLPPWGDEGGGFWVVGVLGRSAIWYNDIEEGFNVSTFSEWGTIGEYLCDQLELRYWLVRLATFVQEGHGFPGESLGAPEPVI